jgi:hypothetical protein
MSNVIRFLEAMGSRPFAAAHYLAAVNALNVGESERQALLNRDGQILNRLLCGREDVHCLIFGEEDVH